MKLLPVLWIAVGLSLAAGIVVPPDAAAETQGMERRDERRDDRDEGRDAKRKCKAGDESRAECREQKRDAKHGEDGADIESESETED
jgi:hypothetical protein